MHNHIDAAAYVPTFAASTSHLSRKWKAVHTGCKIERKAHNLVDVPSAAALSTSTNCDEYNSQISSQQQQSQPTQELQRQSTYNEPLQNISKQKKRLLISEEQFKFVFATLSWNVELQRILLRDATSPLLATFANSQMCNEHKVQRKQEQELKKMSDMPERKKQEAFTAPSCLVHTWAQMLNPRQVCNTPNEGAVSTLLTLNKKQLFVNMCNHASFPSLQEIGKRESKSKSKLQSEWHQRMRQSVKCKRSDCEVCISEECELTKDCQNTNVETDNNTNNTNNTTNTIFTNIKNGNEEESEAKQEQVTDTSKTLHSHSSKLSWSDTINNNVSVHKDSNKRERAGEQLIQDSRIIEHNLQNLQVCSNNLELHHQLHEVEEQEEQNSYHPQDHNQNISLSYERRNISQEISKSEDCEEERFEEEHFSSCNQRKKYRHRRRHHHHHHHHWRRLDVNDVLQKRHAHKQNESNLTIKLIVPSVVDDVSRSSQLYAAPDEVCEAFFNNITAHQEIMCSNNATRSDNTNCTNNMFSSQNKELLHDNKSEYLHKERSLKEIVIEKYNREKGHVNFMPDLYFQPWRLTETHENKCNNNNNFCITNNKCVNDIRENKSEKEESDFKTKHTPTNAMNVNFNKSFSINEMETIKEEKVESESDIATKDKRFIMPNAINEHYGNIIKMNKVNNANHGNITYITRNNVLCNESKERDEHYHYHNDYVYNNTNNDDDDDDFEDEEIPLFQLSRRATNALRAVQAPLNKHSRKQHQLFYESKSVLQISPSARQEVCQSSTPRQPCTFITLQSRRNNLELKHRNCTQNWEGHEHKYNININTNNSNSSSSSNTVHSQENNDTHREINPCTPTVTEDKQLICEEEHAKLYHSFDFFHQMFLRSFITIVLAQISLPWRLTKMADVTIQHRYNVTSDKNYCNSNSNNVLEVEERMALSFFLRYYDAYKEVMLKLVMQSESEFTRRSFQEIFTSSTFITEHTKMENTLINATRNNEVKRRESEYADKFVKSKTNSVTESSQKEYNECEKEALSWEQEQSKLEEHVCNIQLQELEHIFKKMKSCNSLLAIDELYISGKEAAWQPFIMEIFDITRVVQCYAERDTMLPFSFHSANMPNCTNHVTTTTLPHSCHEQERPLPNFYSYNNYSNNVISNATQQQLLLHALLTFIITPLNDVYAKPLPIDASCLSNSNKMVRELLSLEQEESKVYLQHILYLIKESSLSLSSRNLSHANNIAYHNTNNNNNNSGGSNYNNSCNTHIHYIDSQEKNCEPWLFHHKCYGEIYPFQLQHSSQYESNTAVIEEQVMENVFAPLQWLEEPLLFDVTLQQNGVKLYKAKLPISHRAVYKLVLPAEDTEKFNLAQFFRPSIFRFVAGVNVISNSHAEVFNFNNSNNNNNNINNNICSISSGTNQSSCSYAGMANTSYNNYNIYTNTNMEQATLHQQWEEQKEYKAMPLHDISVSNIHHRNNTLVHCSAGMHRSSGLVIAFLLYLLHEYTVLNTSVETTHSTTGRLATVNDNLFTINQVGNKENQKEWAEQAFLLCMRHVRHQRSIAEPILSVEKMLRAYALNLQEANANNVFT